MRRHLVAAVIGAMACGDAAPPVEPAPSEPGPQADAAPQGDPLLATAARSVAAGELAAGPKSEIMASGAPVHARAQALLSAMDGATRTADVRPVEPAPDAAPAVAVAPAPELAPAADAATADDATPAVAASPTAPTKSPRPTLERLSMRASKGGATLVLHAGRGVLVGVANQPQTGVVRLVLDDVGAAATVLAARPSARGARVTDVDVGPHSVRIALALDPGWRFVGVKRTGSGAQVEIAAP